MRISARLITHDGCQSIFYMDRFSTSVVSAFRYKGKYYQRIYKLEDEAALPEGPLYTYREIETKEVKTRSSKR